MTEVEIVYCYNCDLPAGPVITAMIEGHPEEICSLCKKEIEGKVAKLRRQSPYWSQRRMTTRMAYRSMGTRR